MFPRRYPECDRSLFRDGVLIAPVDLNQVLVRPRCISQSERADLENAGHYYAGHLEGELQRIRGRDREIQWIGTDSAAVEGHVPEFEGMLPRGHILDSERIINTDRQRRSVVHPNRVSVGIQAFSARGDVEDQRADVRAAVGTTTTGDDERQGRYNMPVNVP